MGEQTVTPSLRRAYEFYKKNYNAENADHRFARDIDNAIWNEAIEAAAGYIEAKRRQALSPGRIAYYIRTLKREPKP